MFNVGQPIKYVPDDDHEDNPLAGQITKVHEDGRVCLIYWCPERKGLFEAINIPHFLASDADSNEQYFECYSES